MISISGYAFHVFRSGAILPTIKNLPMGLSTHRQGDDFHHVRTLCARGVSTSPFNMSDDVESIAQMRHLSQIEGKVNIFQLSAVSCLHYQYRKISNQPLVVHEE